MRYLVDGDGKEKAGETCWDAVKTSEADESNNKSALNFTCKETRSSLVVVSLLG
jgi:hypothetical protein